MAAEIWLWLREDGREPKAIAVGARPPGPGRVVAVKRAAARNPEQARHAAAKWLPLVARLGGAPSAEQLHAMEADPLASPDSLSLLRNVRQVAPAEFTKPYGSADL